MDFEKEMASLGKMLNEIKGMPNKSSDRKSYDKVGFVYDTKRLLDTLKFFYENVVAKQTGDPKTSYYHLKINPKEHQVVYVNFNRGYPKELFDGHYCYILKKYRSLYLVIPATSVENIENDPIQDFEIDILVNGLPKAMRLNLANIRGVDLQRIYSSKGVFNVVTDKSMIIEQISSKLFGEI